MYVFSIDILFKGSQSLSNMRSKFTAVSLKPLYSLHGTAVLNIFANSKLYLFEKTLTRVSGAQGQLFDEKTSGRKSHVRVP
jgi:hypothetical protein